MSELVMPHLFAARFNNINLAAKAQEDAGGFGTLYVQLHLPPRLEDFQTTLEICPNIKKISLGCTLYKKDYPTLKVNCASVLEIISTLQGTHTFTEIELDSTATFVATSMLPKFIDFVSIFGIKNLAINVSKEARLRKQWGHLVDMIYRGNVATLSITYEKESTVECLLEELSDLEDVDGRTCLTDLRFSKWGGSKGVLDKGFPALLKLAQANRIGSKLQRISFSRMSLTAETSAFIKAVRFAFPDLGSIMINRGFVKSKLYQGEPLSFPTKKRDLNGDQMVETKELFHENEAYHLLQDEGGNRFQHLYLFIQNCKFSPTFVHDVWLAGILTYNKVVAMSSCNRNKDDTRNDAELIIQDAMYTYVTKLLFGYYSIFEEAPEETPGNEPGLAIRRRSPRLVSSE